MTEELYHKDAYLKEVWARVLAIEGKKLLLAKTIFFPGIAHHSGDTGRVDGIPLLGSVKQNEDVWHVLGSEHRLKVGDDALLQLDWKRRHYSMRLHTAMHLLSCILGRHFMTYPSELKVEGTVAHLEFNEEIGIQTISEVLERANRISAEGADIEAKPAENGKNAVTIGYFPEFSCSGLFVKDIKEIGTISLENAGIKDGKFDLSIKVE